MKIELPEYVKRALDLLREGGAEGWLVGGCVRDAMLGRKPDDFDVAVSTPPQETARIFKDYKVVPTGLKHGTVTVLIDGRPLELTTFRRDGEYADSRHPAEVTFVSDVESDLARRDFTVNAAAWSPDRGLCDPFGAAKDAQNGVIRCVGDPVKRFGEDALRILRALRFASILGFEIEENTENAIRKMHRTLADISRERVRDEFCKLICGKGSVGVLLSYKEVIAGVIPELRPCMGFDPANNRHKYDVYEHCVRTSAGIDVDFAESVGVDRSAEVAMRLAGLFHDCAKPECLTVSDDGRVRYPRHETAGARIAGNVLRRLRFDKDTIHIVCGIIVRHDSYPKPNRNSVRRDIAATGAKLWWMTDVLRRADNSAKADGAYSDDGRYFEAVESHARAVFRDGDCVSPEMMDIDGGDILRLGVSGPVLGDVKRRLFDEIVDGKIENERTRLIERAIQLIDITCKEQSERNGITQ